MKYTTRTLVASFALVLAFLTVMIATTGCGTLDGTHPPNAFEQRLFNTETNYQTQIVSAAHEIQRTNTTVNAAGQTITSITPDTVITYVTNTIPVFTHTVKDETVADSQTVGAIANLVAPGSGGLVAALLTGVFGTWARMRSHKKTGTVLAGNIEAIRQFIKTSLPNGMQYDAALVKWMGENQQEAGAIDGVLELLRHHVTNKDARAGALEIQNALDELMKEAELVKKV